MSVKDKDIQFMIECLSVELVERLMEEYGWEMQKALDELFRSQLYEKLNRPSCRLYYQSAVYLFSYLKRELETGKLS